MTEKINDKQEWLYIERQLGKRERDGLVDLIQPRISWEASVMGMVYGQILIHGHLVVLCYCT